ncbi:DUF488 domain-containing protein [Methylophaga sp. OBS4]|uniref:DUF488 domain-containing protein n=1 Tax=Methylophaga sp. OBS4 TaxID=2991935 RepID=UPI0022580433|nr:DUF488 family protein [Methylophaga sp. OBS4]MCX4186884.1 DUF488 family protein [Methylophaga sp. OBS4]
MSQSYITIKLKRVYSTATEDDGLRILADRLWPRGVKKTELNFDKWIRDLCPSAELRKEWHQADLDFDEFKTNYIRELENHRSELQEVLELAMKNTITLLSSVRDLDHSHLAILKEYLYTLFEESDFEQRSNERASRVCYQNDKADN